LVTENVTGRNGGPQTRPLDKRPGAAPAGPAHRRPAPRTAQTHEVILMKAGQPTRRHAAAVWRIIRCAAAALRAVHDEQVLMWEVFGRSSRVLPDRDGALAWVPSLDGPRLTGDQLPIPDDAGVGHGP
jgi:hypothetical protein